MARKKNLKGLSQEEMDIITDKMSGSLINKENIYTMIANTLNYKIAIKCKNEKQKSFVKSMKDEEKQICFGVGSPGTGKTYLSLATALQLLKDEKTPYKSIVVFIPCLESVTALKMGFLKGNLDDKTEAYKQNTINNIIKILENSGNTNAKEITSFLIGQNLIRFEFINFVKGKTFENCICVMEEAEDYTKEDMLLLLTRKGGKTCKMFISGDDKQTSRNDIKNKKQITGLRFAANVLNTMKEVSVTEFYPEDIVRDTLLTEIIKRFEENY